VFACVNCGIRPPNFTLAQSLLEQGESAPVMAYLNRCKDIWRAFRSQIDNLITAVEMREVVDLPNAAFVRALQRPSHMLPLQWLRVRSLDELTERGPMATPTQGFEELVEECQHYIHEWVMDTIDYLDPDGSD
jgi:hypothetical protein